MATPDELRTGVLVVAVPAVVMAVALFIIQADAPIWGDGATVINDKLPPTRRTLLEPFHEHLNAVTIALWAVLPGTAAKMAALMVAHVIVAVGTAAFLVARLGLVPGVSLALPLALLGSAHFDLLMPWQILFMIPLALGLLAIVMSLPRERTWLLRGGVALSIAVAAGASNVGIFIGLALGLWFLLDRRWVQILELVPAGLAWLAWFLRFGRAQTFDGGFQPSLDAIPYTIIGMASGIGGVAGVGLWGGLLLLALGIAYAALRRVRIPTAFVAFTATLVVMFAVLSAFRPTSTGPQILQAAAGRYIYLTGFFLAFGLGIAAPRLPSSRWLIAVALVATTLNVGILVSALPTYPQTCADVLARGVPEHQRTGC